MFNQDNESVKEQFCTSCIGDGLSLAGIGDGLSGSLTKSKHKTWKQILLWSGIVICLIAFILLIVGIFV